MIESGDIKLKPTCHSLTNVLYKGRLIGIVSHSDHYDEAPYVSQTTNLYGQPVHWHHDNIEQAVGWIIRTVDPFNHATEYTKA